MKMGTNYYKLKKPITHLSTKNPCGIHHEVKIWINHRLAGALLVRKDELSNFLRVFSSEEIAYHSHYSGIEKGKVVKKVQGTDDSIVISEYGEIIRVEDLEKEVRQNANT